MLEVDTYGHKYAYKFNFSYLSSKHLEIEKCSYNRFIQ